MESTHDASPLPQQPIQRSKSDVQLAKVQCQAALLVILLGGMAASGPSSLTPSFSAIGLFSFLLMGSIVVVVFAFRKLREIGESEFGIVTWTMLVLTCGQIGGCLFRVVTHTADILAR